MCRVSLVVDKPKFLCKNEVYVKINEPNYDLVCKVHANPDVRFAHVMFIDPNDDNSTIDTLEEGGESGDYKANVTVGVSTVLIEFLPMSFIEYLPCSASCCSFGK